MAGQPPPPTALTPPAAIVVAAVVAVLVGFGREVVAAIAEGRIDSRHGVVLFADRSKAP